MYPNARIPVGSWILVTGVNGLVASTTANLLLEMGYKVRGTVRSPAKTNWIQEKFDTLYGKGNFELVAAEDLAKEGAFDEAVKGVSGVAHIASIIGGFDPNVSITPVVSGAVNALKSATTEPSVKAFVYTSSSWAAALPHANVEENIGPDTWNDEAVAAAWAPPPYTEERSLAIYAASKTQAEQAAWKFVKNSKPNFVFNTILPSTNFGPVLDPRHQGWPTTTGWFKELFDGVKTLHDYLPPQYAIDTVDCARLHVGALLDTTVENQRLFGYGEPYSWNSLLAIFRREYPDRKFIDNLADQGRDITTVANEGAAELLKRFGRAGFTPLEETVKTATKQIIEFGK